MGYSIFLKTPPKPISATKSQNPSGRDSTELRFLGVPSRES